MYESLKEACRKLTQEHHKFEAGDIVEWKSGLRNKKSQGPFVVTEILPAPVMDKEASSWSTYFREPLDIIVGLMDADGDFVCLHIDSRRLQPVKN